MKGKKYCVFESLSGLGRHHINLLPNLKVTGITYFHFNPECYCAWVASEVV